MTVDEDLDRGRLGFFIIRAAKLFARRPGNQGQQQSQTGKVLHTATKARYGGHGTILYAEKDGNTTGSIIIRRRANSKKVLITLRVMEAHHAERDEYVGPNVWLARVRRAPAPGKRERRRAAGDRPR